MSDDESLEGRLKKKMAELEQAKRKSRFWKYTAIAGGVAVGLTMAVISYIAWDSSSAPKKLDDTVAESFQLPGMSAPDELPGMRPGGMTPGGMPVSGRGGGLPVSGRGGGMPVSGRGIGSTKPEYKSGIGSTKPKPQKPGIEPYIPEPPLPSRDPIPVTPPKKKSPEPDPINLEYERPRKKLTDELKEAQKKAETATAQLAELRSDQTKKAAVHKKKLEQAQERVKQLEGLINVGSSYELKRCCISSGGLNADILEIVFPRGPGNWFLNEHKYHVNSRGKVTYSMDGFKYVNAILRPMQATQLKPDVKGRFDLYLRGKHFDLVKMATELYLDHSLWNLNKTASERYVIKVTKQEKKGGHNFTCLVDSDFYLFEFRYNGPFMKTKGTSWFIDRSVRERDKHNTGISYDNLEHSIRMHRDRHK
jgi:hypothetical protein